MKLLSSCTCDWIADRRRRTRMLTLGHALFTSDTACTIDACDLASALLLPCLQDGEDYDITFQMEDIHEPASGPASGPPYSHASHSSQAAGAAVSSAAGPKTAAGILVMHVPYVLWCTASPCCHQHPPASTHTHTRSRTHVLKPVKPSHEMKSDDKGVVFLGAVCDASGTDDSPRAPCLGSQWQGGGQPPPRSLVAPGGNRCMCRYMWEVLDTCVYACVYMCVYVCVYTRICVHMCVCVCVCAYIHGPRTPVASTCPRIYKPTHLYNPMHSSMYNPTHLYTPIPSHRQTLPTYLWMPLVCVCACVRVRVVCVCACVCRVCPILERMHALIHPSRPSL